MKNPLISIITPVYNHEKYIKQCIESAINQTFTDWEMLIIDDASTDNSLDIIKKYSNKDKRIRLIMHKNNWGADKLIKTYNQSLKYVKGKYLAILESDDYWPKNKLATQLPFLKPRTAFSFGNCVIVDKNGLPINYIDYNSPKKLPKEVYLSTIIFNKKRLVKIGGFKRDIEHFFCDVPTIRQLIKTGKYVCVPNTLGYYRKQPTSNWFKFGRDRLDPLSNFARTIYYQMIFNLGFIFYPRYLSKYLIFRIKKYIIFNKCKAILNTS